MERVQQEQVVGFKDKLHSFHSSTIAKPLANVDVSTGGINATEQLKNLLANKKLNLITRTSILMDFQQSQTMLKDLGSQLELPRTHCNDCSGYSSLKSKNSLIY